MRNSLLAVVAISASLLASVNTSYALDGTLKAFGGAKIIVVWKSTDARSEGQSIIDAGGAENNIELLAPLISCVETPGTKVVVTDAGLVTHDVLVVEGENKGCRGNIAMEELNLN